MMTDFETLIEKEIRDRAAWDEFAATHPDPHMRALAKRVSNVHTTNIRGYRQEQADNREKHLSAVRVGLWGGIWFAIGFIVGGVW